MADSSPNTQYSLIGRLHDPKDLLAWENFIGIYTPVIERVAARRGMQAADIDNLVQEVWITVANHVVRSQLVAFSESELDQVASRRFALLRDS
jgi:RNA polymerase sigma-70 factor (ECF subfamily)